MWLPVLSLAALLVLPNGQSSTANNTQDKSSPVQTLKFAPTPVYSTPIAPTNRCTAIVIESYDPEINKSELISAMMLNPQYVSRYRYTESSSADDVHVQIFPDVEHEGANHLTATWGGNFFIERNVASKDAAILASKLMKAIEKVCEPSLGNARRRWPYTPKYIDWSGFSYCVHVNTSWASESTITRAMRRNQWISSKAVVVHDRCEAGDHVIEVGHLLGTVDWPFRIVDPISKEAVYSNFVSAYEERRAAQRIADMLATLFAAGDTMPPVPQVSFAGRWKAKRLAVRMGEETGGVYDVRFEGEKLIGTDDTERRFEIPIDGLVDARVEGKTFSSPFDYLRATPEQFESAMMDCERLAPVCAGLYFGLVIPSQLIRLPDKRIVDISWEDPLGQQEISLQITSGDAFKLERIIDQISRVRRYGAKPEPKLKK